MRIKSIIVVTLTLFVVSCTAGQYDLSKRTINPPGQDIFLAYSPTSNEVFKGKDRGTGLGRGELVAISNTGKKCKGYFRLKLNYSGGYGRFKCDSGERGKFVFYRQGRDGFGCGIFTDGRKYYSSYGEVVARKGRRATELDCKKAIKLVGAHKLEF